MPRLSTFNVAIAISVSITIIGFAVWCSPEYRIGALIFSIGTLLLIGIFGYVVTRNDWRRPERLHGLLEVGIGLAVLVFSYPIFFIGMHWEEWTILAGPPLLILEVNPIAWLISVFGMLLGAALVIDGMRWIFLKGQRRDLPEVVKVGVHYAFKKSGEAR